VVPRGFFPAASEGVFRAISLVLLPAAFDGDFTGALPPAFPGASSEALAAARTGALQAPAGAAPYTGIEAA